MRHTIQPILTSGETKLSDISVFRNEECNSYEVYINLALLERVSIDPDTLQHKMFIGRLYNQKTPLKQLVEKFHHDGRTIRKWAAALTSGNIDEMVRAFSGRGANKKVTPELFRYVRQLYKERSRFGRNYREVIISKTQEVFGVTISTTVASAIFKDARSQDDQPPATTRSTATVEQSTPHSDSEDSSPVNQSPVFPAFRERTAAVGQIMIRHVGLILFSGLMRFLASSFDRQLICQVLQGAVNIEQSKILCSDSLRTFVSQILSVPDQRTELDKSATPAAVLQLYRQNAAFLADGPENGDLFYFDPHTKEYTGQLKVLKGWCGRRHGVSKVLNLDCFHTRSGRPCFIQHYSPYYDMRERFFISMKLFDELFDEEKRLGRTFVIDRGIYGLNTFRHFGNDYFITWEKGYRKDGWDANEPSLEFTRERCRNNRSDLRSYHFVYQEHAWQRDTDFRRLIVKATNPRGNTIDVAIITSNPHMDAQDIIWAIFNRWLQENDFKYLDTYFGINQITSYRYTNYKDTVAAHRDRQIDSPEYKQLKSTHRKATDQLSRALLKLHKAERTVVELDLQYQQLHSRIDESQTSARPLPEQSRSQLDRELKKLTRRHCRKQKDCITYREAVETHQQTIETLEERLCCTLRKTSRLEHLIAEQYQLLDTRMKSYFDALKVIASNMFYHLHNQFRLIYGDYRDDHVHLRMLTRCNGSVSHSSNTSAFRLWLPGSFQPHQKRKFSAFLNQLQEQINRTGNRPVRITLTSGPIAM
jgi:predicted  nucleic acid-binding Zn-ribbon protein